MISFNNSPAFIKLKKLCRGVFHTVLENTIRAVLLLISTAVLSLMVLYFYQMLWQMYRLTYVGRQYVIQHPKISQMISSILSKDLVSLSIDTTLSAFAICAITCAICQVFYFTRYFYQSQNIIGKILLWGFPLTAAVSMYMSDLHGLNHWTAAIPIAIVPTLCVFAYCFEFTAQLLPEIGDVIRKIFLFFRGIISLTTKQAR